jgi:putative endonuclease
MLKKGSVGELGEKIAAKYLQNNGYAILATDFHAGKYGEIDIVAQKDGRLFFVEVKTRSGNLFGSAEESVTFKKQERLRRAVHYYLLSNKISNEKYQIDLIAINLDKSSRKANIKHYESVI